MQFCFSRGKSLLYGYIMDVLKINSIYITFLFLLLLLLHLFAFFNVPELSIMYADAGTAIPSLTQTLIQYSNFLREPFGYLVLCIVGGITTAMSVLSWKYYTSPDRKPINKKKLSLVMLLCGFILLGFVALAIYLPIFSLGQTVNGLD